MPRDGLVPHAGSEIPEQIVEAPGREVGSARRPDLGGEQLHCVDPTRPDLELLGEDLELAAQDGGLQGIEPACDAQPHVVVAVRTCAVDADGP